MPLDWFTNKLQCGNFSFMINYHIKYMYGISKTIQREICYEVWDGDRAQCSLVHPYLCSSIFSAEEQATKNSV